MDGPQAGEARSGGGQEEVPKSRPLENSTPTFLVDTFYLGELTLLQENIVVLLKALLILIFFKS